VKSWLSLIYPKTIPETSRKPGIRRVAKQHTGHQYLAAVEYTGLPVSRASTKSRYTRNHAQQNVENTYSPTIAKYVA
jgi:hypothetical protein